MSKEHDWRISTVFDGDVSFEIDLREFFVAYDRTGCPKPKTLFESVPKWAAVAYAVAGETGLRWANVATDAERCSFRAAVRSAVMLGGMGAARHAAQAFVGGEA